MDANQVEFKWMYCPHCRQKLFRYDAEKLFNISIACSHCKAIYRIETGSDGTISTKQEREPKFGYIPRYNKNEG